MSQITFDDILLNEKFILTDREICVQNEWYKDGIYGTRFFSQINDFRLSEVKNELDTFISWLSHPKVHTATKVFDELEQFKWTIYNKLITLNEYETIRKKKKSRINYDNKGERKKLLEDICFCYIKITKMAKKKIFKPEYTEKFEMLEKIVLSLTDYLEIKKEDGYVDQQIEDIHPDEQLVALALYRSLVHRKQSCIVTVNKHIKNIVAATEYFLTEKSMPGNTLFLRLLKRSPIRSYYVINGEIIKHPGRLHSIRKHYDFTSVQIPDFIKDEVWQYLINLKSEK